MHHAVAVRRLRALLSEVLTSHAKECLQFMSNLSKNSIVIMYLSATLCFEIIWVYSDCVAVTYLEMKLIETLSSMYTIKEITRKRLQYSSRWPI
jgi:hypothetical protein